MTKERVANIALACALAASLVFVIKVSARNRQLNAGYDGFERQLKSLSVQSDEVQAMMKNYARSLYLGACDLIPGADNQGLDYIQYFRVYNGYAYVQMKNEKNIPVQPKFRIIFIDVQGRCTGFVSQKWIFDRLNPGAQKNDALAIQPIFDGTPVYYVVQLLN